MAEPKTRFDLERAIREKAVRDDAFRAALTADPKGTLQREVQALTGQEVKLPENVTVTVHEETPERIHLVIPARVKAGAEIGDAELERIAGGTIGFSFGCPTVFPHATCWY